MDPQRALGDVRGHARVAVAIAADPAAPVQERADPRWPGAGPGPGIRSAASAARRRIQGGVHDPRQPRRQREQRGVEERHRRPDLVEDRRGDRPQVRRPPQEGDLLAEPAADFGILGRGQARVVQAGEQVAAAAQGDQDRPAAGFGRVGGEDRRDRQAGQLGIEGGVRPTQRAQSPDRLRHRIVEDAVAGGSLAATERPDAPARLGQVDQLEVEGEGADDGFDGARIESRQVVVEASALGRVAIDSKADRALADALDEVEQVRAGLLRDDLAQQARRAAGPRSRAGRGRRPCRCRRVRGGRGRSCGSIPRPAARLGRPVPSPARRSRPVPLRGRDTMPPQPFASPTFPTLVS